MTDQKPSKPPPSKLARAKRLALSAVLGVMVALVCQALPPQYQIPCRVIVKLLSLFIGGNS